MRTRLHPGRNCLAILTSRGLPIERQTSVRSAARLRCQIRTRPGVRLMIAALRVGLDRRRVLLDRRGTRRSYASPRCPIAGTRCPGPRTSRWYLARHRHTPTPGNRQGQSDYHTPHGFALSIGRFPVSGFAGTAFGASAGKSGITKPCSFNDPKVSASPGPLPSFSNPA